MFSATNTIASWIFVVGMGVAFILDSFYENNPVIGAVYVWILLFISDFSDSDSFLSFTNFVYFYVALIALLTIVIVTEKFNNKTNIGLFY